MSYHSDGMYPTNESIEKFLADYEIAKELSELGYVTRIIVNFNYSLPYDYWT